MDLREAVARHVLGFLRAEALPNICSAALESGFDSPTLTSLAGEPLGTLDFEDARRDFDRIIEELGFPTPSFYDAADTIIRNSCLAAVDGVVSPHAALAEIAQVVELVERDHSPTEFVGDTLGVPDLIGMLHDYDELGKPWVLSRDDLDSEVLIALRARTHAA
jgi:hypothetical protein